MAAIFFAACDRALDAGYNVHGKLPADRHNPVILINDTASDNWSPEYAVLLANDGGLRLVGIIVTASPYWPDLTANMTGWDNFVTAAKRSNLDVPELTPSSGPQLIVPPNRQIASTKPNDSAGAELILRKSRELSLPGQPLVLLACSQLTDIADAFLVDPTVVERVVVVAQVGTPSGSKWPMSGPNGDLDPWADWIVGQYFTYVQISAFYDQGADVTAYDLPNLPKNPLGDWMVAKHPNLSTLPTAADQETALAVAVPGFITSAVRSIADTSAGFNVPPGQGPPLVASAVGNDWVVTQVDASVPRARLWQLLTSPTIFQP